MNILLGLTDNKDIMIIQALLLLESRSVSIDEVHYIRTASDSVNEDITRFYSDKNIKFSVSHLYNNGILKSEQDYLTQEDALFKWYVQKSKISTNIYVFIGGGHKLHSLALQRCAFLFGATDVFHMFVNVRRDEEPKTIEEIRLALEGESILYASLGKESGWPALLNLTSSMEINGNIIRNITQKIGNRSIGQINEYPFESITLLPSTAITWLNDAATEDDVDFILHLPKVELHCHLGGFAAFGEDLIKVREAADDTNTIGPIKDIGYPDHWPMPYAICPLDTYMKLGDNNGSYILKNIGCLKRQIELLYSHFIFQNIGYAEVRCSPFNYSSDEYTGLDILQIIQSHFDLQMAKAKHINEFWCHVNLIIIATRTDDGDTKKIEDHLELARVAESNSKFEGKCKIVGVDLAGFEHPGTRPSYYNAQFSAIHRKGMALTIHAGENDDSEAIWDAVFKLNTRRIGHGLHLYQDQNLLKSVINRKIGIEMCPYANYQIKGFKPMKDIGNTYPLVDYLRKGAAVTINTDNIGISAANLTDNFLLAIKMNPELTRMEILQIIRNGLEQAFIDVQLRNLLIKMYNERIFILIMTNSFY